MRWNVDFEIASIIYQLVFLCFFAIKKHLPTRQNRMYVISVIVCFAALVMDVVTAFMNSYPSYFGQTALYGVNLIFFILDPLLAVCFFLYILTLAKRFSFTRTPLFAVFMIPAGLAELVTITSPVTGYVFYVDSARGYMHGPGFIIQMAVGGFYVLLALLFSLVHKKSLSRLEFICVWVLCFGIALMLILQSLVFPDVLLVHAMTTLALITVYLSLENSDVYLDRPSGMFNRDAFRAISEEYIADGKSFSCVFLTIADYKNMDAVYGTENMDEAVSDVIRYLKRVFSTRNVFRLGNRTFVIQEKAEGDFEEVTRALEGRFEKPFKGLSEEIVLDALIVAIPYWHMPHEFTGIDSVFSFAANTGSGRHLSPVVVVDEGMIERMERERRVEHAIENAIAVGSIQIYYQPIYSSVDGKVTSCEALARLFDEDIGFIPPEEFIKKAEETGSIVSLGTQIFEKVCIFIKDHRLYQYSVEKVHVNLSPFQFKQESLAAELIELTQKYEVDRSCIVLEITETAAVEGSKVIHGNMDRLIDAGFSFSLDDYGTGFSNTASIIRLPFSSVKIDKSLLWAYFNRQSDILPDLINMFINQKLDLIAEGVETREMVDTLVDMHCMNMQGYYFSKPLPEREFISYVWEFNR